MQRERVAEACGPVAVEGVHTFAHRERRTQRALGVVFMGDGRAKDGHDGVAQEFIDIAFVLVHRAGQRGQQIFLEAAHDFGIELLGDGGKGREVGEHDADLFALALDAAGGAHLIGQFFGNEAREQLLGLECRLAP